MHQINHGRAYLCIIAVFFIQMSLGRFLDTGLFRPDLMIVITVFLALFTDEKFGARAGAASGLLLDIFSIRFFGLNTVLFALCGYLIGKHNVKFYKHSLITHFIVTFTASLVILITTFLFIGLHDPSGFPRLSPVAAFNPFVLLSSSMNSFLSVFMYTFLCTAFSVYESDI